jgi:hypothetical protein
MTIPVIQMSGSIRMVRPGALFELWHLSGVRLDPLEAVVTDDQAQGRGAGLLLGGARLLQRIVELDQHRADLRSPG